MTALIVTDGTRTGITYPGGVYWVTGPSTLAVDTTTDTPLRAVRAATYPEELAASAYRRAGLAYRYGMRTASMSVLRNCEATLAELLTIAAEEATDA